MQSGKLVLNMLRSTTNNSWAERIREFTTKVGIDDTTKAG